MLLIPQLTADRQAFPAPSRALTEPSGLLAFGGDLSPQRMLSAYRQGIFPGSHRKILFSGGPQTPGRYYGLRTFMSAAVWHAFTVGRRFG